MDRERINLPKKKKKRRRRKERVKYQRPSGNVHEQSKKKRRKKLGVARSYIRKIPCKERGSAYVLLKIWLTKTNVYINTTDTATNRSEQAFMPSRELSCHAESFMLSENFHDDESKLDVALPYWELFCIVLRYWERFPSH